MEYNSYDLRPSFSTPPSRPNRIQRSVCLAGRDQTSILFAGYRRVARFLIPYRWRLIYILLTGVAASSFGLMQPYISKLLIDEALLRRNFHALLMISLMMVGATALSFALNILSSYQYVGVSAAVLFDMRVALYKHLESLSPRFWARSKLGDVVSR